MTRSAIAKPTKRPPTPAERLAHLDPDLAVAFDEWEESLDREYDLAFNENPPPTILEAEVELATEGWRLLETAAVLYAEVEKVHVLRDAAQAALSRLALEVFNPAGYTTYQRALPPPDSFDGGDPTEDFHALPAARPDGDWDDALGVHPDVDPWSSDARTVRVGGWWRRAWTGLRVTVGRAATALWGVA